MINYPTLTALRRHKAGVILICIQIALTLAILCNALFIISQRIERIARKTGIAEANLILVTQSWVSSQLVEGSARIDQIASLQAEDVAALRAVEGVEQVATVNTLPLLGATRTAAIALRPDQGSPTTSASYYYIDQDAFSVLKLRLLAGRAFDQSDVRTVDPRASAKPPAVIVTQALAASLGYPGDSVGRIVYLDGSTQPSRIVGVVDTLQTPSVTSYSDALAFNSVLVPGKLGINLSRYAIRTREGSAEKVVKAIGPALYAANPQRLLSPGSIQRFEDIRSDAYRADFGMAVILGVMSVVMLTVTTAGIVGLTSFWVRQRRRQIGVRRALGATRSDILFYFLSENILICSMGAVVGIALAAALNRWLMSAYEMESLPLLFTLIGSTLIVAISQGAAFIPARSASRLEPAVVIRGR